MLKESDTDDYYEEPDSPRKRSPLRSSQKANAATTKGLNDLNEPSATAQEKKKSAKDYMDNLCTPDADEYFARLTLELEEEEKDTYMSVGRGRSSHQIRKYSSRPPVQIKNEIPHCDRLPAFLATRGSLSRRGRGRGYCECH